MGAAGWGQQGVSGAGLSSASAVFLLANFGGTAGGGALLAELTPFEQFAESLAGIVAVEELGASLLHFNFEAGGSVFELDAGRGLIDALAARAGAAHKVFVEILFGKPTGRHPSAQGLGFRFANAKVEHGGTTSLRLTTSRKRQFPTTRCWDLQALRR